jgi:hypothetical protein
MLNFLPPPSLPPSTPPHPPAARTNFPINEYYDILNQQSTMAARRREDMGMGGHGGYDGAYDPEAEVRGSGRGLPAGVSCVWGRKGVCASWGGRVKGRW